MVLEKTKIKHSFSDAAKTYDSVASLQRQIGRELLNIDTVAHLQGVVLDLGCGTGFLTQELAQHCHHATLIALDLSQMMLERCREKVGVKSHYVCADAEKLPLKAQSVNAIFSNVALQWCYPIDEALSELHRASARAVLFDARQTCACSCASRSSSRAALRRAMTLGDVFILCFQFCPAQAQ